jgi:hypothetical protein
MLNQGEQYRSLIAYLRETERAVLAPAPSDNRNTKVAVVSGVIFLFLLAFSVGISLPWIAIFFFGPIFLLMSVVGGILLNPKKVPELTEHDLYKIEAHKLLDSLRAMERYNRLHRDLSEASLTILDEIARLRQEVFHLLEAPFWKNPHLSETYARLRRQSLEAANQSILDAVVQFRMSIPPEVRPRHWSDIIDEVASSFVRSRGGGKFTEPGFDAAFDIAQKMQALKIELQEITHQAGIEKIQYDNLVPGSAIDAAMNEIRTLRLAEEELKQGL